MLETWRWFGPEDPVSLEQIRQAGAAGIVSALGHVATGEAWPLADILAHKALIEADLEEQKVYPRRDQGCRRAAARRAR